MWLWHVKARAIDSSLQFSSDRNQTLNKLYSTNKQLNISPMKLNNHLQTLFNCIRLTFNVGILRFAGAPMRWLVTTLTLSTSVKVRFLHETCLLTCGSRWNYKKGVFVAMNTQQPHIIALNRPNHVHCRYHEHDEAWPQTPGRHVLPTSFRTRLGRDICQQGR